MYSWPTALTWDINYWSTFSYWSHFVTASCIYSTSIAMPTIVMTTVIWYCSLLADCHLAEGPSRTDFQHLKKENYQLNQNCLNLKYSQHQKPVILQSVILKYMYMYNEILKERCHISKPLFWCVHLNITVSMYNVKASKKNHAADWLCVKLNFKSNNIQQTMVVSQKIKTSK